MTNILDLVREQQMNQATPSTPPSPTEKAQIVIFYTSSQQPTIVRYNTAKKGEKEFAKLKKAWDKRFTAASTLHDVDADMFICTVDLTQVACICYVDHAKRAKFVPVP